MNFEKLLLSFGNNGTCKNINLIANGGREFRQKIGYILKELIFYVHQILCQ